MISVVICSAKNILAQQVKLNIENTIGVPWEPVIIDNSITQRSITEVYNLGVKKASFPVICFVHEDIEFLTKGWGGRILSYFQNDLQLGMVGVAGAAYKSKFLSGWMTAVESLDRYNIIHRDAKGNEVRMYFDQAPSSALKNVVVLDGVFLCTRKEIVEKIPFNEEVLKGFHLYDIDVSFRISRLYKIAVSFEIDILHFTEGGDFGNSWVENTLKWHKQYAKELPVTVDSYNKSGVSKIEFTIKKFWLRRLKNEKISFRNRVRWIVLSGVLMNVRLWPDIILFFLHRSVKRIFRKNHTN